MAPESWSWNARCNRKGTGLAGAAAPCSFLPHVEQSTVLRYLVLWRDSWPAPIESNSCAALVHAHPLGDYLECWNTLEKYRSQFHWLGKLMCSAVSSSPNSRTPWHTNTETCTASAAATTNSHHGPIHVARDESRSALGNKYIIIIMESSSLPGGPPTLQSHLTKHHLVLQFSQVGIPSDILIYQGTLFPSSCRTSAGAPSTGSTCSEFRRSRCASTTMSRSPEISNPAIRSSSSFPVPPPNFYQNPIGTTSTKLLRSSRGRGSLITHRSVIWGWLRPSIWRYHIIQGLLKMQQEKVGAMWQYTSHQKARMHLSSC